MAIENAGLEILLEPGLNLTGDYSGGDAAVQVFLREMCAAPPLSPDAGIELVKGLPGNNRSNTCRR